MYDLNVKWKATKPRENSDVVKQLLKLGWSSAAWTTPVFGKLTGKATKQSSSVSVDASDLKECMKSRGLLQPPANEVTQLSRITITVDDVVDCQVITTGNQTLRAYDIVAACPGNAAVFAYLCRTAQVDIISIDFSRHVPFPLIKKQMDQAVERGIHFEILYGPLLTAPSSRKEVLAGTRVLVQFLRGRNIILSSGTENATDIRGPFDVINMGQLLNLSAEQAKAAITKNCEAVIAHGRARKLKFVPLEVVSTDEAVQRWPKYATAKGAKQGAKRGRDGNPADGEDGAGKRAKAGMTEADDGSEESGGDDRGGTREVEDSDNEDANHQQEAAGVKSEEEDDGYLKF